MDYNGDQGNRSLYQVTIRIMTDNQKEEKRTRESAARECADPTDMVRGAVHSVKWNGASKARDGTEEGCMMCYISI